MKEQEASSAWRAAWRARSTRALRRRGEVRGEKEEGRRARRAASMPWGMRRLPAMNSRMRKASAAARCGMAAMAMPTRCETSNRCRLGWAGHGGDDD